MSCVENIPPAQPDSEREEGEIVDELDDLSEISSEEEFLLRQRLQVLENYNNVLERKKAKRSSTRPGKDGRYNDALLCDLSDISAAELDEPYICKDKEQRHLKSYHKPKRRKVPSSVTQPAKKEYKKKSHKSKRKVVLSESSDESDDEYRNKRRKLANAVSVNKATIDKTSLKARLTKMFLRSQNQDAENFISDPQTEDRLVQDDVPLDDIHSKEASISILRDLNKDKLLSAARLVESVDLCSDTEDKDAKINTNTEEKISDTLDSITKVVSDSVNVIVNDSQDTRDSDEDLELLREHALKTKASKTNVTNVSEQINLKQKDSIDKNDLLLSDDEDSDTAELRSICLKSAFLKKAIEIKQKQKHRKRFSQSCNLNDELMNDQTEFMDQMKSENNTDIESVDMDIGSDADDKGKEFSIEPLLSTDTDIVNPVKTNALDIKNKKVSNEEELEEDEDLLRAKLLTSLSKNLPNLVDPTIMKMVKNTEELNKDPEIEKQVNSIPEEKRFIISLGNSDSEGEHEATKNLTKMHIKLSDQAEFQQRLDLFLKSTRMEVEKSSLPDLVQQPLVDSSSKPKEKFIPKTVKHLPKSEQIEYKNLVKKMAELEKIKNARQSLLNKGIPAPKDTLKPRNVTIETQKVNENLLNEQIALSRKNIAEESAKVLKLKEEAMNLSQKKKIVVTELHNISTAITLNKKEQKLAQIRLSKIRTQHQLLLNSSKTSKHSMTNGNLVAARIPQKLIATNRRLQKENNPKEDVKNPKILKSMQVSVVNDLKEEANAPNPRLSIQIDITSNKKTVKIPQSPVKDHSYAVESRIEPREKDERRNESRDTLVDRIKDTKDVRNTVASTWGSKSKSKEVDDYTSPLQALGTANWEEDPNAVLCPFEVAGNCKDPDCKYLHPRIQPVP